MIESTFLLLNRAVPFRAAHEKDGPGQGSAPAILREVPSMLYYALVFFLIAVVAAILGFGGIAVAFAGVARILFFLFVVIFLVSLIMGLARRGPV